MSRSVLQVSYALAPVSPDAVGGAEQILAALDEALVARGVEVGVVAPVGSRTAGTLFESLALPERFDDAAAAAAVRAQAAALAGALRARRFERIHLHGLHFDAVLPDDAPPAIATLHLPPAWYAPGALRRGRAALVCVSEAQARSVGPGVRVAAVIPNGVRLDRFRPAPAKAGYALVLARICPEKGVHVALDAARRAGVPLLVGGAAFPYDAHLRYLEGQVRPRLDSERRLLGPVARAEKARLLGEARCLVVASLAEETSSLVAMEALASGTPVVARRTGALPEVVDDGVTGFLVDGDDELADAIRDTPRLSPAACRRAAEARFSADEMVRRYVALYDVAPVRRRPPAPRVAVEELHGLGALEALAPEWSDLAERDPGAAPFQRPEWLLPYCRAFGVADPWAVSVRRGGRLAALAPLVVYQDAGRRVATLLGGGRSDWQDAVVDPELAPDGAGRLLARIAARHARYDALLLERLPERSPFATLDPPAGLAACEAGDDDPCPVLALPPDPARLEVVARPALLESVRYGRRRLARTGAVAITTASEGDLDRHLDALLALHGARWSERGERGMLADAAVARFLRDAARALAARGLLRCHVLSVDGRPAAAYLGFLDRGRAFYYLGGFDPALRAASPGTVVVAHAIEDAIRAGARELDFLRGREPYKYAWGARDRPAVRRVLVPRPGRSTAEPAATTVS